MKRVLLVALLMVTAGVSLGSVPAGAQDEADADGCAARTPADVSLVIDRSGSMNGDKIQTARDGATRLVENMTTQDQSGLVSFASSATLDKSLSFDHAHTISEIGDLVAGGGTNIGSGIDLSVNDFANNGRTSARPIMIVLSDGLSSGDTIASADAAKAQGIEIFSIALGSDADHATMEAIASEPTEDHFFAPANTEELLVAFEELTGAVTKSAVIAEAYNLDIRVEDPATGTSVIVDRLNQQTMPIGSSDDVANVTVPVAGYNISATALYAEATGQGGDSEATANAIAQVANFTIRDPSDKVILSTGLLTAASSSMASQGDASASADGTSLASVTVDGTTMDANVPVNTTIPLGPLGNVTLNEQNTRVVDGQAEQSVRLIHASLVAGSATVEVTVSAARTAASCGVAPSFDDPEANEDEPTVTSDLPDFGNAGIERCAFEDDMESGVGDWTHSGAQDEWELGTPTNGAPGAASGDNAWGTDLDANYNNNADQVLSPPPVDLSGFSGDESINLTFALYFHSENYYDGGVVEAQTSDGVTTLTPAEGPAYDTSTYRPGGAAWSGDHGGWQNVTFDVSGYAGEEVTFRFRMATDSSVTYPGMYIDDVSICGEAAIDPGQVPSPPATPSTSLSCVFQDDMESGEGGWTHSGPGDEWELGTPTYGPSGAASGENAWGTDLSSGYSSNSDQVLTSPAIDLRTALPGDEISLTTNIWAYHASYDDASWVEVDDGTAITKIEPVTEPSYTTDSIHSPAWHDYVGGWHDTAFNLSAFAGEEIQLRFRLVSDPIYERAGLFVDDVSVCIDRPVEDPEPPTTLTSLSCVFQDDFEARESAWTHSGPGDEWELGTPTYGPSGAASGQNAWGTDLDSVYSTNSDQVLTSPMIDLGTALPGDPIEMSANIWSYTYLYDDAAWVEVDDGTTVTKIHPVTGPSYDTYSSHSPAWHFYVNGWHETTFNLTQFAGEEIQLRFRLASDSLYQRAGLYVDDVSVCIDRPVEDPEPPTLEPSVSLSCVFQDDMESGEGAWTHSGAGDEWELGTPSYYVYAAASGDNAWGTDLDSRYSSNSDQVLTSPAINLRTALPGDPIEMSANIWSYTYIYNDAAWVEVDNGTAVTKIHPVTGPSYTTYSSHSPAWHYNVGGWHETTFNLTEFAGEEIQLRFRLASDSIYERAGLFVDDVSVCIDRPVEDPDLPTTSASLSCVFEDDMESGEGAWSHSGPGDEWELGTPTYGPSGAASGQNAWGTDLDSRYGYNTDQLLTSPVIDLLAVPPGLEVTLTTNIWADLYGYGDAAWVEVDDGTTVTKIEPTDGALYGTYGAYAPSWAGYIGGWEETSFDLSPFAGEEIQLGFRLVSDSFYTDRGLYVDDVSVCIDSLAG